MLPPIASTLGIGSGIDVSALIDGLVAAERGPRDTGLRDRTTLVTARISGTAQLQSGFDSLISALSTRTRAGALGPLPISSDTTVLVASAVNGAVPQLQATEIDVRALAASQTLVSAALVDRTAAVGTGTLTLRSGTKTDDGSGGFSFSGDGGAPVDIVITAANNSLTGLRDALNAAQSRVVASIIDDGSGARLVLKGGNGAASAFILTSAPDGADLGLDRFVHKPGTSPLTEAAVAHDAEIKVDGVTVKRGSNSIADLIPGVRLELRRATPGVVQTITASRDPGGLHSAITDTVEALNALRSVANNLTRTADATGPAGVLLGDSSVRSLKQQLSALAAKPILPGTYGSLAGIGVQTQRDGSYTINETLLSAAIAAEPDSVEKLLVALTTDGTRGTSVGALVQVRATLTDANIRAGGVGRYAREQAQIARETTTLDTRITSYRAQLVQQFAAMERAVTALNSTRSFLDQQLAAQNASNN